jgi:hypothetical protein
MRFALGQRLRSGPQIGPLLLDFRQRFRVSELGFNWIPSLKAELLFAFADSPAQSFGNALFGASRFQSLDVSTDVTLRAALYHLFVPLSRCQAVDSTDLLGEPGA